jgi:hypothetical protein
MKPPRITGKIELDSEKILTGKNIIDSDIDKKLSKNQ